MNKNICIELRIEGKSISIVDGDNGRYVVSRNGLSRDYVTTKIDGEAVILSSEIAFDSKEEIITQFLKHFAEVVGADAEKLISRKIVDRLCFAYKMNEPVAISAFFAKGDINHPDFAVRRVFLDANNLYATFMAGKAPMARSEEAEPQESLGINGSVKEVISLLELRDEQLMLRPQSLVDCMTGDVVHTRES